MLDKPENVSRFRKLLPRGAQKDIAAQLGITEATVSLALDKLDPRNKVVQTAVRMAHLHQRGVAGETEKMLNDLLNKSGQAPQPVA